jgi:hypothetical protein
MSLFTRAYLSTIIVLAGVALAVHLPSLAIADPLRFVTYASMALISAAMKVRLPGVSGTLSVLFLFLLVGIVELSLPETLLIAIAATLVQSYWRPERRPKAIKVVFSASGLVLAVVVANTVYTAPLMASVGLPWRVAAAAFTFFLHVLRRQHLHNRHHPRLNREEINSRDLAQLLFLVVSLLPRRRLSGDPVQLSHARVRLAGFRPHPARRLHHVPIVPAVYREAGRRAASC